VSPIGSKLLMLFTVLTFYCFYSSSFDEYVMVCFSFSTFVKKISLEQTRSMPLLKTI
jgi:hypothetical protein